MAAVLRAPGVARLGAAGLLSEIGDWMLFIGLPLYVLQLSGSPLVTATVFALELVPAVLVGPFAGVLIDRFDPWRLMAGVATAQALLLLPLLAVETADDLWLVYAVVVVESVLGTVIEPCRSATAAVLVPAGDLLSVNRLMGVLSAVARLVGAPVGGVLLGLRGIDAVLVADAATFAAAAALFAVGRRGGARAARPAGPHGRPLSARALLRDWAEGLAVVAGIPVLRRLLAVAACMALAQGAFLVLFVLFVVRDLGGSEADVGVLRGVQAIGAITGGALLGLVAKRWDAGRLVTISLAAFGAVSLVTWNAPTVTTALWLYVGLFVVAGMPGLAAMTGLLTLLQTHSPAPAVGRVMGTFFAVQGGVQAAGMLLAGLAGTGVGLTAALQLQAGMYLVAAALAWGLRPGSRVPPGAAGVPGSAGSPRSPHGTPVSRG